MQKLSDKELQKWRVQQSKLTIGRICPFCGKIIFRRFNDHLIKHHNITAEDWYCMLHNIEKYQHKCKICGNDVEFDFGHVFYKTYCCRTCQAIDRNILIGSNFSFELTLDQRIKRHLENDSDYKKWQNEQYEKFIPLKSNAGKIGGVITSQKCGSNFSYYLTEDQRIARNLSTDQLYLEWQDQQYKKLNQHKSKAGKIGGKAVQKLYGCSLPGIGYRSNVIFADKQFHFDSQCELFHFLTKVFIDDIPISRISNDQYLINDSDKFNGAGAYTDLIISSDICGLINYEVHNADDLSGIARKKFCSEQNGFCFVLENTYDYTYPFGKKVQQLSSIRLNVDKLYSDLTSTHYNYDLALDIKYADISASYF